MDMIQAMIEKEYIKEREGNSKSGGSNQDNASAARRQNKFSD